VKIIVVNPDKCTGCRLCELACSLKNAGEFNPTRARIHVIDYDEMFCNIAYSSEEKLAEKWEHCDGEPECVLFCPTGALEFREADTAMPHKKIALSEKLMVIYEGIE